MVETTPAYVEVLGDYIGLFVLATFALTFAASCLIFVWWLIEQLPRDRC